MPELSEPLSHITGVSVLVTPELSEPLSHITGVSVLVTPELSELLLDVLCHSVSPVQYEG